MIRKIRLAVAVALGAISLLPAAPALAGPASPLQVGRIVLVHYAGGPDAVVGDPAKPGKGGGGGGETAWFKDSGLHWAGGVIRYFVVSASTPSNAGFKENQLKAAIAASFAAWDDQSSGLSVSAYSPPPGGSVIPGKVDGYNVVGWADLGETRAIAITYISYNTLTKEIIEVDTALNSNASFSWWINSVGGDPDQATWTAGNSPAYDCDVQNIMAHEAGHWLCLNDLYNKPASTQTMYGISPEFELQKRSLESGDIAGVQAIYGK